VLLLPVTGDRKLTGSASLAVVRIMLLLFKFQQHCKSTYPSITATSFIAAMNHILWCPAQVQHQTPAAPPLPPSAPHPRPQCM
jgi:hypothetical protein